MTDMHPACDVQHLCRLAGLSRATYYRHLAADGGDRLDHELQGAIKTICLRHKYYGYRRVTQVLRRQGHMADDLAGFAGTTMSACIPRQSGQSKKRQKTKRHACTLSEAAEIHFEPAKFGPAEEREKFFQRNLIDLRMAVAVLGLTKAELVNKWRDDEAADIFMRLHGDLQKAAEWFRLSADFIDKAALRLMISAAAEHRGGN